VIPDSGSEPLRVSPAELDQALRKRIPLRSFKWVGKLSEVTRLGHSSRVMTLALRVEPGISREEVRRRLQLVMADLGRTDITISNA